ncbi:hypothetical protein PCANC_10798 [Puccinia coronata f. sp. avenae]|uniref:RNase H type-1 domain-containing protein n=1 Tax=Puccinia coronata f. sp. avenae TaxID=200324 RepID=A0A2N5V4B6_9BASI|nr:hypothetical protein PCANC_10798 [Puccinia coronata f. sp. avenae]
MVIKPNNIIRDFILNSRADSTAKFADSAQLGLAAEKVNVAMALKPENIYLPFEYGVGAARDLECRLLDMSKEDAINSVKSLISSYDSDPEARVIFSDGSFHPEKGGAGTAVCPGRNVFSSFALGGNTLVSNHESEAAGVLAGLGLANVLSSGTDVRRILRLVDNQGVIRRVNDPTAPKPGQGLFAEIDRALATLPEHLQVTLAWCPGHRDILGNEMADQLAKESLESSSAQRGLIAARPKGACQPPHALPRVPHAVLTPTNGACTAGTPVRPGSRKPLESRGLCEPLGTLIRVPSGTLIRVPVGTLIRIPVGTLIRVPSGTLIRVPSGTLIRVPVGTLIRVPTTGTLIRVPTGTLIRVPTGTLIRVPLGTLIRVPLGTLIRVPRGSRKPLDSRGLREPGRTGVRPCTPVRRACKACTPSRTGCMASTPVWRGCTPPHTICVRGAVRTPFGRAAIKPPAQHLDIPSNYKKVHRRAMTVSSARLPNPSELHIAFSSLINQLASGHCALKYHLFKICRALDPLCPNCGARETVFHFMNFCPKCRSIRVTLRRNLRSLRIRFKAARLDAILNERKAEVALAKFLQDSQWFPDQFPN